MPHAAPDSTAITNPLRRVGIDALFGWFWRLLGIFRDQDKDVMTVRIEMASAQVDLATGNKESAKRRIADARKQWKRLAKYHGWK